jgi:serine/threonine protein kinase
MFRIVEDKMPPLPEGCSELLQDFLSRCFHKDPSKRPSAEMLFEHKWLQDNWGTYKVSHRIHLTVSWLIVSRRNYVHKIASRSSAVSALIYKSPKQSGTYPK